MNFSFILVLLFSLVLIVLAQSDLPYGFDIGLHSRPEAYACFKKNPDCVLQGLEHSDCIRFGGTLTGCESLDTMQNCHSCHAESPYRFVVYSYVKRWCVERGGTVNLLTDKVNICTS